jgi:hypothetical protein
MLRNALTTICLAVLPTLAAAAPKNMTVYGRVPVGAFGVDTLEHVERAAKLGMTLIYSYSPSSARKQLDLKDAIGQAAAKHKMQVMYPLCGRFTQVRLAREIKPTDTTIPVVGEKPDSVKAFPESGYLMIEGERIEYATRTADAFGGCRRGAAGTQAASHGVGLLLCNSEALRKEILAIKDAPGLWGYWLVDNNRPREIDSLREMSRIIRLTDRDAQGRPNRLSAEALAVEGRSYPLKVNFPAWNKADPKSDRWPIAQFSAGDLTTTDWSQVAALEQPIYNPGDETIAVLISLEDAAKGWWQRTVEIPPRVPMLLRVPMDEVRLTIDPGHIRRWLLWEADPPAAVEFRLGTPMLVPAGGR